MAFIFHCWLLDGLLVLTIAVLATVTRRLSRRYDYWESRGVPNSSPRKTPPPASRHRSQSDADTYHLFEGHPLVGLYENGHPVGMIREPELLRRVLVQDFQHFEDRETFDVSRSDPLVHRMMTNKTGREWKDQRSLLSPVFTSGKLRSIMGVLVVCCNQMADHLEDHALSGEDLDANECLGKLAMDMVASQVFGTLSKSFQDGDGQVFVRMAQSFQGTGKWIRIKQMANRLCPRLVQLLGISIYPRECMKFFARVVTTAIQDSIVLANSDGNGRKREDLLQLLLEARRGQERDGKEEQETDQFEEDAKLYQQVKSTTTVLTDEEIISQCILFLVAGYDKKGSHGYDTMTSLLSFAAYELALHPEIQTRLAKEVLSVLGQHDGNITYESIREMEYLDMVVQETLRKYPPGVRVTRVCTKDYIIPETDITITQGTFLIAPVYAIHHDPKYYPNPKKFDPERFSPEQKARRHPYVFLPFGHGPRNCIGMRFALLEAKTALAMMVQRYQLEPCARTRIPLAMNKFAQILKIQNGLWLKVKKRERVHE